MDRLIGREYEIAELKRCIASERSEFAVVYGRRRVGKTFLIRKFFNDDYAFHYVGAHRQNNRQQLDNFSKALQRYSGTKNRLKLKNWSEAFDCLETYLESRTDLKRKVIFIDEMPWIDNKQSGFVDALEYFWNSWVMGRDDIVLIACGSATSWMIDKLIENQGGMRGRITRRIYLHPFSLAECKAYFESRGFDWDEYQIIQNYMVMGGIPYYMSMLEPRMSLPQNIDSLFFSNHGLMRDEFDELYNALFTTADKYIDIVRLLAEHREGLERTEIESQTKISGGTLTTILKNLERCDFIKGYAQIKKSTKGVIYKLIDFYTIFYYKFVYNNKTEDENYWLHNFQSRSVSSWQGLTFELVCLVHAWQIKHALGISGVATEISSWREPGSSGKRGAQVDLIIKRADKVVHLCEMKFSEGLFSITADYEETLKERKLRFGQHTGIQRGVVHTFVTPYGVSKGKHYSIVHSEVTARDLFVANM